MLKNKTYEKRGVEMSKERLEEIIRKEAYLEGTNDLVMVINKDDYRWLIKQAERVEELEKKLSINTSNMKQLQKRNERYKQALEFYADEENYCVRFEDDYEPILQDNGKTARQALGWEESE